MVIKLVIINLIEEKMASDLHRTATTAYLCCVPTLEEFAGAGRVGLAGANIQSFYVFARKIVRSNCYICHTYTIYQHEKI